MKKETSATGTTRRSITINAYILSDNRCQYVIHIVSKVSESLYKLIDYNILGKYVGDNVGCIVGSVVGDNVGCIVGSVVGDNVGCIVGLVNVGVEEG